MLFTIKLNLSDILEIGFNSSLIFSMHIFYINVILKSFYTIYEY